MVPAALGVEGAAPVLDLWPQRLACGVIRVALQDLTRRATVREDARLFLLGAGAEAALRHWCGLASLDVRRVRAVACRILAGERLIPERHRWAAPQDGGRGARCVAGQARVGMACRTNGAERSAPAALSPIVCRVCGIPIPPRGRARRRLCGPACRRALRRRVEFTVTVHRPRPVETVSCPAV